MKDYRQFLNEAKETTLPLQILNRGKGLTGKSEPFTDELMSRIFDKYVKIALLTKKNEYKLKSPTPPNRRNKIDFKYPILNFTGSDNAIALNKDGKGTIFNKLEDYDISANKVTFQKEFSDATYIPKTVYSLDDIEDLKLPIIAKPAEGMSAQGIEKFETYDEARKSDLEFDLWCECKELSREFRAFIMGGELIIIAERVTNTKNDQSVGEKDADDKIDLIYIEQDIKNFPFLDKIKSIQEDLDKKVKLDLYTIDLMLDEDGELWVPEINGAPGIGPSFFRTIYKKWLEMAYDTTVSKEDDEDLKEIQDIHRKEMKKEYPKEHKSSLKPI